MESEVETLQNIINTASGFLVNYGFQLFGAFIILIVGWLMSRWTGKAVFKLCQKTRLDITLSKFFASLSRMVVFAFVIIIALGKFGISIAPFIAALGAVAFGGTLALQGPLSNYGSGLTIILTRPFVVGDTIKVLGVTGVVQEIKLAYTYLKTEDGELITIPNKHIVGEVIHNSFEYLVVEARIGISYGSNPDTAVDIIRDVLTNNGSVAEKPPPQAGIIKFSDSALEISYRYWVPAEKYYQIQFMVNSEIFKRFRRENIIIPYPQRDVRIIQSG